MIKFQSKCIVLMQIHYFGLVKLPLQPQMMLLLQSEEKQVQMTVILVLDSAATQSSYLKQVVFSFESHHLECAFESPARCF